MSEEDQGTVTRRLLIGLGGVAAFIAVANIPDREVNSPPSAVNSPHLPANSPPSAVNCAPPPNATVSADRQIGRSRLDRTVQAMLRQNKYRVDTQDARA